ncbi:MAG: anaerobic sulfatase maturase [Actinobacteria bacterium]|nr:anaerobic sulfatase maturase [Actinomycetota bacterium]
MIERLGHPFHLLAKPTGAVCNLDCTYCFFLSKDTLYPGDRLRMGADTLRAYLTQMIAAQPDGPVNVAWQGGEPTLMGLDFYREALSIVTEVARPGQTIEHTMQTNGTLLDESWADFLAEHHVLVGLSIDGRPDDHDRFRVWKDGRGSHGDVLRAWDLLRRHGVECNVLCSLSAANVRHPLETYRYLRDELGARHIQFIPIVERATTANIEVAEGGWGTGRGKRRILYTQNGHLVTSRSITGDQYGEFLCAVFDEWVSHDVGEVFVQLFDVTLGAHFDQHSLCVHSPTCGSALALEHNGDLYSCDHFVEPDHLLGNIHDSPMADLVASPQQVAFGRHKLDSLPRMCLECEVRFACHGGCPKDRFATTPDGEPGLNHLCNGYKTFFTHCDAAMRTMADLIRRGRYADEIMRPSSTSLRTSPTGPGERRGDPTTAWSPADGSAVGHDRTKNRH